MQTRPFLRMLTSVLSFGLLARGAPEPNIEPLDNDTQRATGVYAGICRGNSGASNRWRQKHARPHGRRGMRNRKPSRQILTNVKYMHRSQRERFARGQTIYV